MVDKMIFGALLLVAGFLFTKRILFIKRNILLGKDEDRSDRKSERWMTMALVALGQSKMVARPVAGILHILVYLGFIIINIEMLEIVIDGLTGSHRAFAGLGSLYTVLIASFEVLALLVLVACAIFLVRRHVIAIARFKSPEMGGWPSLDATIILVAEILLMSAFLTMNAADAIAMAENLDHYEGIVVSESAFPISSIIAGLLDGVSDSNIVLIERFCWWFHIAGVLSFLVYVPYSKHFHIFLAFPNTYYSNLEEKGRLDNMASVKKEVDLMMDPNVDPYTATAEGESEEPPRFGVKDANDLSWKQLMEAYSCTECGRCTSECPANTTGKLLSPRKIMMDSRDRIEEIGKNIDANGGEFKPDGKSLVGSYITEEELWACTSCQACVEACPINISPMGIILDMRRSLIMEESKSPEPITSMFNNIENNGAPWAFPAATRGDWINNV
ncbi:MAG: Fe-S oxidoreductase [Crocinitomicaceae bacterium]|nr:Fe-S oxidoreductase [Crocinitomicaceae bacterium]|tara:strand:- start:39 stop:1373 length:1335 start_codon:yes stop_codon:yes gene_type:complete